MKVVAAMSGGVDSSVAAARILDEGHEVVGVHLALSRTESSGKTRGCCTLDDARDARRVADKLGIPFYVWDFSEAFAESVMADFLNEYAAGRTPNPCLRCNEKIKFSAVMDRALALGFDAVATGHYAQIVNGPSGPELHRAKDPDKDQSYVLAVMERSQLAHAMFPLGGDLKSEVRADAERRGLVTARKPDSHDICFIPDGDTAGFLTRTLGEQVGEIVDRTTGTAVGTHQGTFTVTIGQRRGLGLSHPAEDGKPRYVVDVDPRSRIVTVGPVEDLMVRRIEASPMRWLSPSHTASFDATVQVRAHGAPVPARIDIVHEGVIAHLVEPIQGLAPGQSMVIYNNSMVVGSATINATDRVGTHSHS